MNRREMGILPAGMARQACTLREIHDPRHTSVICDDVDLKICGLIARLGYSVATEASFPGSQR
jgi:hypothetical protein